MSTRGFGNQARGKTILREPYLLLLLIGATLLLGACATMPGSEPIQVAVAGIEPLPGEGLEVRMLVKLRVQNPNDAPINYDGVSLKLDVQGQTYGSGVSDVKGTIPRFGEAVIEVPVSVSTLRAAFQAYGQMRGGKAPEKLKYKLTGKLGTTGFGSLGFATEGELDLTTMGQ